MQLIFLIVPQTNTPSFFFFKWSTSTQKWVKIGDVLDAVGSSQKKTFEGREYDYVFDVDIREGSPALKLPFNVTGESELLSFVALYFQLHLVNLAFFIFDCRKSLPSGANIPQPKQPLARVHRPSRKFHH